MSNGVLTYWSCPNYHLVLNHYMPQSGKACNVRGCEGLRTQRSIVIEDIVRDANRLAGYFFDESKDVEGLDEIILSHDLEKFVVRKLKERLGL